MTACEPLGEDWHLATSLLNIGTAEALSGRGAGARVHLERALASADGDSALAQGVRLVLSDLNGVLAREGVSTLEPEGEQFDPTFHEALSTRSEDGAEAGVVLDVVEKGYRLGDTVIRPARVVVSA